MKLFNSDTSARNCSGFNIHRRVLGEDTDFAFYAFSPFIENQDQYAFYDTDINYYSTTICYKVATIWSNKDDTCISAFSKTIHQTEDYVCILTSDIQNINEYNHLTIYPNPATNKLNITTKDGTPVKEIRIYNLTGQLVFRGEAVNNSIDISRLQDGMYVVEVVIGQRKIRKKLMVK